jgi:hypothetical protein
MGITMVRPHLLDAMGVEAHEAEKAKSRILIQRHLASDI